MTDEERHPLQHIFAEKPLLSDEEAATLTKLIQDCLMQPAGEFWVSRPRNPRLQVEDGRLIRRPDFA